MTPKQMKMMLNDAKVINRDLDVLINRTNTYLGHYKVRNFSKYQILSLDKDIIKQCRRLNREKKENKYINAKLQYENSLNKFRNDLIELRKDYVRVLYY